VTIRVADRQASERFYDTVLSVIGSEWNHFSLLEADEEVPVTRGLHTPLSG
jgi:hypothetical protein